MIRLPANRVHIHRPFPERRGRELNAHERKWRHSIRRDGDRNRVPSVGRDTSDWDRRHRHRIAAGRCLLDEGRNRADLAA